MLNGAVAVFRLLVMPALVEAGVEVPGGTPGGLHQVAVVFGGVLPGGDLSAAGQDEGHVPGGPQGVVATTAFAVAVEVVE